MYVYICYIEVLVKIGDKFVWYMLDVINLINIKEVVLNVVFC